MNNKCLVIKPRKFLIWQWVDRDYKHDFLYESRELRKCAVCGVREMLISKTLDFEAGGYEEDWRTTV